MRVARRTTRRRRAAPITRRCGGGRVSRPVRGSLLPRPEETRVPATLPGLRRDFAGTLPSTWRYDCPVTGKKQTKDDFETKHIDTRGTVLHRAKSASRGLALGMLALTVAMLIWGTVLALGLRPQLSLLHHILPWLIAALGIFVGLTRTVVRTVTTEEVRVMWGLWGPRIPIEAITKCQVTPTKPPITGAELYAPTLGADVLLLEWVDDRSKARKAIIGADDPHSLAASIQEARAGRPGARIEKASDSDTHTEAEQAELEEAAEQAELEEAMEQEDHDEHDARANR